MCMYVQIHKMSCEYCILYMEHISTQIKTQNNVPIYIHIHVAAIPILRLASSTRVCDSRLVIARNMYMLSYRYVYMCMYCVFVIAIAVIAPTYTYLCVRINYTMDTNLFFATSKDR